MAKGEEVRKNIFIVKKSSSDDNDDNLLYACASLS